MPLPQKIADLLRPDKSEPKDDRTSRSLLFDRGCGRFDRGLDRDEDKAGFLDAFRRRFSQPAGHEHFAPFLARRRRAFDRLGARAVELTTTSRLVVGLGLPHPVETGFLLDRLTGCPYLPASSVKGLLRAIPGRKVTPTTEQASAKGDKQPGAPKTEASAPPPQPKAPSQKQ